MEGPDAFIPPGHGVWFALSLLASLALFGFFVVAVVQYFLRVRYAWRTRRLAAVFLGATIPVSIFSLVLLLGGPMAERTQGLPPGFMRACFALAGVVGIVIVAVQGFVYTGAGAYLSVRARQPHFPFLRSLARAERRGPPRARGFPWRTALLASAAAVAYSALVLGLAQPQISPLLRKSLQSLEGLMLTTRSKPLLALVVVLIAVKEEIVFRLFLQTQFARWLRASRRPDLWAILATSAIWTLAHAVALDPAWVKFVQIFPLGLLLGALRRRWGVEPCILVHAALNLAAVFLLSGLVPE